MMNQMTTGERPYSPQLVGPGQALGWADLGQPYQDYEAIYQLVGGIDAALERGVHFRINGGPALFALSDVIREMLNDPRRD